MASPYDIESGAVAALTSETGKPWATRVPNPRPDVFGRVSRIGGSQANLITEAPLLLVECWAQTEVAAFDLAGAAWSLFEQLGREGGFLGAAWVMQSFPSSPISFYDSSTGLPRFQFTVNMLVSLKESA